MAEIVSLETLRQKRRSQTLIEERVPYIIAGEMRYATKRIAHGEMVTYDLDRPIGEMITTPQGLDALVQKVVLDLELGREEVPLLYKPIYRTHEDANFPQHVEIQGIISRTAVVFAEHLEGEEVRFGTRTVGARETVPIVTYAAALGWTKEVQVFDQTWQLTEASRAFGEAYNALLNHLHLGPILQFNYPAKNKTAAVTSYSTLLENIRATLRQALIDAANDKDPDTGQGRRPTVLLCHPSRRMDIEEALGRLQIGGTVYPPLGQIDTIILYDGYSIQAGNQRVDYPGVDPTKAYLIDPQRYFRELVKFDLRVEAEGPTLTRLLENTLVGWAMRGLYAAPARAVQEVTLP